MLKDKKLIKQVINERARIRMRAMNKLYRLLKSATREWEDESEVMKSNPLKSNIVDQIRDYFNFVNKVYYSEKS